MFLDYAYGEESQNIRFWNIIANIEKSEKYGTSEKHDVYEHNRNMCTDYITWVWVFNFASFDLQFRSIHQLLPRGVSFALSSPASLPPNGWLYRAVFPGRAFAGSSFNINLTNMLHQMFLSSAIDQKQIDVYQIAGERDFQ